MVEQLLTKSGVLTQGNVWFSCQSRQLAMQLLAWCRHDIAAPAVEPLVSELLGSRERGHWSTTQGNAWSLLAMTEFFEHIAPSNPAAAGKIEWGTIEKPFALENQAQVFTTALALGVENASHPLRVSNNGAHPLFVRVEVEAYPASSEQAKHDAGYGIERSYARIEDDGQLTDLNDARVGDRVLVTLAIEVRRPAGYLVVDDPLPAIFEPVNPVFKTQETRGQATLGTDWLSDHKELRVDRALFFADSIAPGRYIVRYLARVCAAGTATAPSAKVEEMYQPDRFGLSGSARVSSRSLE